MTTGGTNLRTGRRTDAEVEFLSRRTLDYEEGRIDRLLVTDGSGQRLTLFVTGGAEPLPSLESGAAYRVSKLLGADPPAEASADAPDCPDCGEGMRPGGIADAVGPVVVRAARDLGLDRPFGLVDADASVRRIREDAVDDWTPMGGRRDAADRSPDYVCPSCGRLADASDIRGRPGGADRFADHPIESAMMAPSADPAAPTVGLAAGGAKDVNNFRENVANGYTPRPEALSDEGLFYDYRFETGGRDGGDPDALFAPRYAAAVSDHPLTGETERYLSVGLDSTLSTADFDRPRLDLVAVLDVSGSMSGRFDAYYYDEHGRKRDAGADSTTKLAAATRSLCALTEHLRDDDRFGVVLYNRRAHVAKPLRGVGATDMDAIRRHVGNVVAGGGTNLEEGFDAAVNLFDDDGRDGSERRVVFTTDMMPNVGATDERDITRLFADAAAEGIHTTFVGMGLDANAALADALGGIRGANHYFVHSADEFERRLGEEFDYMVTPLVYDLDLELEADGYEVAAVHGSPSADAATGRLMHVGTLFPSAKRDGEARGGVILVRLARTGSAGDVAVTASWTERDGDEHVERVPVTLPDEPETFAHPGVRKAVALARYARELRAWARGVHEGGEDGGSERGAVGVDDWRLPDRRGRRRGRHERPSVPLVVADRHADRFDRLREYLDAETEATADRTMGREVELLGTLCETAAEFPPRGGRLTAVPDRSIRTSVAGVRSDRPSGERDAGDQAGVPLVASRTVISSRVRRR